MADSPSILSLFKKAHCAISPSGLQKLGSDFALWVMAAALKRKDGATFADIHERFLRSCDPQDKDQCTKLEIMLPKISQTFGAPFANVIMERTMECAPVYSHLFDMARGYFFSQSCAAMDDALNAGKSWTFEIEHERFLVYCDPYNPDHCALWKEKITTACQTFKEPDTLDPFAIKNQISSFVIEDSPLGAMAEKHLLSLSCEMMDRAVRTNDVLLFRNGHAGVLLCCDPHNPSHCTLWKEKFATACHLFPLYDHIKLGLEAFDIAPADTPLRDMIKKQLFPLSSAAMDDALKQKNEGLFNFTQDVFDLICDPSNADHRALFKERFITIHQTFHARWGHKMMLKMFGLDTYERLLKEAAHALHSTPHACATRPEQKPKQGTAAAAQPPFI